MPYELESEYEFDIEPGLEQTWEFEEEFPLASRSENRPFEVSHFPRYSRSAASLPPLERAKIHRIVRSVASGLRSGRQAIRTIRLTGHADLDTPRRPAFEHQVALARARDVGTALSLALDGVDGSGRNRPVPPYSSRLAWEVRSAGATQPVVPNPRSNLDRLRNRRVEIALVPYRDSSRRAAFLTRESFGFAEIAVTPRLQTAIDDFLRRAPNDRLRRSDPISGPDQADRRICVQAVATKAMQLCGSAKGSDRDVPCDPPLTLTRGRCHSITPGIEILAGKDYRSPIIPPVRCCDFSSDCRIAANRDCVQCRAPLGRGHYLVLKYKPGPLKRMVQKLKCLLDRGCAVPVGVLSGTCDDKPDLTCKVPPANRWRDCWEHWLLVIGYDGDTFVFWDSAEASAIGPKKPDKDNNYFGRLFYDSKNDRLSTATTDPSVDGLEVRGPAFPRDPAGFHTQGFDRPDAQKRYQVVSMWPGLPWKVDSGPCPKVS
jgi:hypothetical protein